MDSSKFLRWSFDLETGGLNESSSPAIADNTWENFLAASAPGRDYRESRFFKQHFTPSGERYQILEFATRSRNLENLTEPARPWLKTGTWSGFHHETPFFLRVQPDLAEPSKFAYEHDIVTRSLSDKAFGITEEALGQELFRGLEQAIGAGHTVDLAGWNAIFDVSNVEALAWQYPSLTKYRGFLAEHAAKGNISYTAYEDPVLKLALQKAKEDPQFGKRYLRRTSTGDVAQTLSEMREVPGWAAEKVVAPLGGFEALLPESEVAAKAHTAWIDERGTSILHTYFESAWHNVEDGATVDEALHQTGLFGNYTSDELFGRIFDSSWSRKVNEQSRAGERILGRAASVAEGSFAWRKPLIGAGVFAGAAIALGLATGKRRDRQTQIEGLAHRGVAGRDRKRNTDFGSGWQGLDENSSGDHRYAYALTAGGLYAGHQWALRNVDGWAQRSYQILRDFEDASPRKLLRTLGLSQRASQYLPGDLSIGSTEVYKSFGNLGRDLQGRNISNKSRLGEHLQRLMPDVDLDAQFLADLDRGVETRLDFKGAKGDPYKRLFINDTAYVDAEGRGYQVRFMEGFSSKKWASVSERYGAPLGQPLNRNGENVENGIQWLKDKAKPKEAMRFTPFSVKKDKAFFSNLKNTVGLETFNLADRLNRMLHDVHLDIPTHTYNGTAGLVTGLLAKRVLPAAAAGAVLGYADYLLGHAPSNFLFGLGPKARVLHAEATDMVPGGRETTDWYAQHVPGPQYGPLALPALGALAGGLAHYSQVLSGTKFAAPDTLGQTAREAWQAKAAEAAARTTHFRQFAKWGAIAGGVAMLPFLPGMLGSRKSADDLRAEYSGDKPVAIRAGRWWQFGTQTYGGGRITAWRPHAYALHKSRAEDLSLYGSEEEKWAHNPFVSPLTWFKDPNWLAKKHEQDRPYPITSPAFANVPLIGSLLASTIGRVVAPPHRMHEEEWDGSDYTLYSKRVEPRGDQALPPDYPTADLTLGHTLQRGKHDLEEIAGLPGFLMRSGKKKLARQSDRPSVSFEGTSAMTDPARRFYEKELGGLPGWHPEMGITSYSEPIRRFLEHDPSAVHANEIPNAFSQVSWLPGSDYMTDFKKGDPYSKVQSGYARLPGAGYEALHPEVKGLAPEDYPEMSQLEILSDVAPWSSQFKRLGAKLNKTITDTAQRVKYEQIMDRAKETTESSVRFAHRHTGKTERLEGTVRSANEHEVQLEEYPGQYFSYSGVDMRASALASEAQGASNRQLAAEVDKKRSERSQYLSETLAPGTQVKLTLARGGAAVSHARAVVEADGQNVNQELIKRGLGKLDLDRAGAEVQAMDGPLGRLMRNYAEAISFQGDQAWYNPMRYLPSSIHTKLWNERTPLEAYINQEVSGTRMRRWQRPIHDFLKPYLHGAAERLTGRTVVPPQTQHKRDLETLTDELEYLRALFGMGKDPQHRGAYALAMNRTSVGADLFGESGRLRQTLSARDRKYFDAFLEETNPEERERIAASVSPEMHNALMAQWAKQSNHDEEYNSAGRFVTPEDRKQVAESVSHGEHVKGLSAGDYLRAREIAEFFQRRGLHLPDADSEVMSPDLDMEDVKVKIVQWEGLDYHDFGIYDDRVAMLWRKPYLDGAVRELTSGDDRSLEETTYAIEQAIAQSKGGDRKAKVRALRTKSHSPQNNIKVRVEIRDDKEKQRELRRNREEYAN